jgi:hypothetical protein
MDSLDDIQFILCIIASCVFYYLVSNVILVSVALPKNYLIVTVTGEKLRQHKIKRWKNGFVALVHAILASGLIGFLVSNHPEILTELTITSDNELVYFANCFVVGYFIYNTLDSLTMYKTQVFYETMLHHFIVLTIYSIVLLTKNYIACVSVFIFFEINNIFLNIRQILFFYEYDKTKFFYRINSILNMLTFIVFRLGILVWVSLWFSESFAQMHILIALTVMFSLFIFSILNVILFVRCVRADLRFDRDLLPLAHKFE